MVKVLVVRRVNPVVSEVVDQADLSADVVMTNSKHETPDGMVLSVYLVPAVNQYLSRWKLEHSADPGWKDDPSYGWARGRGRLARAARGYARPRHL